MTPGQLEDAGGLLNRSFSGNCPPNPLASVLENCVFAGMDGFGPPGGGRAEGSPVHPQG